MNQLPATTDQQRVIPQVDNVLMEFLAAGQNNELLAEILLQLKTFTAIVDIAASGAPITVGLEWPEIHHSEMELYGQTRSIPIRPRFDPNRPYFYVTPTINMRVRDKYQGTDMHKMLVDAGVPPNGYAPLNHQIQAHYTCSSPDMEIEIDISMYSEFDYTERFVKLLLVMFNATPEMKAKVDHVASLNVKVKTPLEDALFKVCKALAAFYDFQMRTSGHSWCRDPFTKPQKEAEPDQIEYEPRLGRF